MTTSIAIYYLGEIDSWRMALEYNLEESERLEKLLRSVLEYNTIPGLAAKTNYHLGQLQVSIINLHRHLDLIDKKEKHPFKGKKLLANADVSEIMMNDMIDLRRNIRSLEKEFIDVKYDCDEFIAGTIMAQQRHIP